MTDVRHFQTDDGGNIAYTNGQAELDDGLGGAAFLSMFGGNEDDNGSQATERLQWWGNLTEPDATRHYRSEFQALIETIPVIPTNLPRFQDAAARDLAWMTSTGLATFVDVVVTIPGINALKVEGDIEIDGDAFPFEFTAAGRANDEI